MEADAHGIDLSMAYFYGTSSNVPVPGCSMSGGMSRL